MPDCINKGSYVAMVTGPGEARPGIQSTPTVKINGQDFDVHSTPDDLVAQVKAIVGDVPGLMSRAASPDSDRRRRGAVTVTADSPAEPATERGAAGRRGAHRRARCGC